MDPSLQDTVSKILEGLNEQREKLSGTVDEMHAVTESATTKNKMIKATVNGQGKLTEVAIRGDRWRDLSPKELGTAIVEAVTRAQEKARVNVTQLMADIAPAGMNIAGFASGKPDIDDLFPDLQKMWRNSSDE